MPQMKAARRAKLWRPLPPRPTSSMLPPGWLSTRQIRLTCSTANRNMAKFIGLLLIPTGSSAACQLKTVFHTGLGQGPQQNENEQQLLIDMYAHVEVTFIALDGWMDRWMAE